MQVIIKWVIDSPLLSQRADGTILQRHIQLTKKRGFSAQTALGQF